MSNKIDKELEAKAREYANTQWKGGTEHEHWKNAYEDYLAGALAERERHASDCASRLKQGWDCDCDQSAVTKLKMENARLKERIAFFQERRAWKLVEENARLRSALEYVNQNAAKIAGSGEYRVNWAILALVREALGEEESK